jgi:hypothetical protein
MTETVTQTLEHETDSLKGLPPLEQRLASPDRFVFTAEERQGMAPAVWYEKGTGLAGAPRKVEDFAEGSADLESYEGRGGPERAEAAQDFNRYHVESITSMIDQTLGEDNKQAFEAEDVKFTRHEIPHETGDGESSYRYDIIVPIDHVDTSVVITRTGDSYDVTFHGEAQDVPGVKKERDNLNGSWTDSYLGLDVDQENIEQLFDATQKKVEAGIESLRSQKNKGLGQKALDRLLITRMK